MYKHIRYKKEEVYTKIVHKRTECMRRKIEIEDLVAEMVDGIESALIHKRYIEF